MAIFDKPFYFESLVRDISSRYHLGPKGRSLVEEALDLIAEQPDGTGGFLDRFRAAGLGAEVTSWLAGGAAAPISGQQVEEALGAEAISEIADRAGTGGASQCGLPGDSLRECRILPAGGAADTTTRRTYKVEEQLRVEESNVCDLN
jgi:YidB-like protein